jgi:Flp pilus assembly protein TadB
LFCQPFRRNKVPKRQETKKTNRTIKQKYDGTQFSASSPVLGVQFVLFLCFLVSWVGVLFWWGFWVSCLFVFVLFGVLYAAKRKEDAKARLQRTN